VGLSLENPMKLSSNIHEDQNQFRCCLFTKRSIACQQPSPRRTTFLHNTHQNHLYIPSCIVLSLRRRHLKSQWQEASQRRAPRARRHIIEAERTRLARMLRSLRIRLQTTTILTIRASIRWQVESFHLNMKNLLTS
jgi:hypothetical protein